VSATCNSADIKIGAYTIKACNVGASTAGIGIDSYGCYFQRGNNYGFANTGNILVNTSTIVDVSNYAPSTYSSGVFLTRWLPNNYERSNLR
jgi:hypothetical protein